MQDQQNISYQQNISNQQFEVPLTFPADKKQFISYVRQAMSDGAIMLNKMSSAFDRIWILG